jgi:hypothetical protein
MRAGPRRFSKLAGNATDKLNILTQQGTGLVSAAPDWQTRSEIGPYINGLDYITADGVTNDATSLQAAINAAGSSRRPLFLPPGTIICNSSLTIPSYVEMRGSGKWSTLIKTTLTTGQITLLTVGSDASRVRLSGFGLEGFNTSTLNSGRGIVVNGTRVTIEDLEFINCWRGVYAGNTSRLLRVQRCDFTNPQAGGSTQACVRLDGARDFWIEDNYLEGVSLTEGMDRGILVSNGGTLYGAQHGFIKDNRCDLPIAMSIGSYVDDDLFIFELQSAGFTPFDEDDVGKRVEQNAVTVGTLVNYDNTLRWMVVLRARDPSPPNSFIPAYGNTVTTLVGGVGGGTTNKDQRRLEFLSAGFTPAVDTDIGKPITNGSTETGTLLNFDNDKRIWAISCTTGDFPTGTAATIPTGAGAGTTDGSPATAARMNVPAIRKAPAGTHVEINANICTRGQSTTIGEGIAIDEMHHCVVNGNIVSGCAYTGIFVGDGENTGTVISNNSVDSCKYGLVYSRSNDTVSTGNIANKCTHTGVRIEPTVLGGCDRMVMAGNAVTQCGVLATDSLDSAFAVQGVEANAWTGNLAAWNYRYGMYVLNSRGNAFSGGVFADNGYAATAAYGGFNLDGSCQNNLIAANMIKNYNGARSQYNGIQIQTSNSRSNMVGMNVLDSTIVPYTDSGLGDQAAMNAGIVSAGSNAIIEIANNGVVDLQVRGGFVFVYHHEGRRLGMFLFRGATNNTIEILDSTGNFSATAGTANSFNLYYSSGYKLENKIGSAGTISLYHMGV